jgi:hypothetical protein
VNASKPLRPWRFDEPARKISLCFREFLGRGARHTATPNTSLIIDELANDLWPHNCGGKHVAMDKVQSFGSCVTASKTYNASNTRVAGSYESRNADALDC